MGGGGGIFKDYFSICCIFQDSSEKGNRRGNTPSENWCHLNHCHASSLKMTQPLPWSSPKAVWGVSEQMAGGGCVGQMAIVVVRNED